jgi:hypothetical protein
VRFEGLVKLCIDVLLAATSEDHGETTEPNEQEDGRLWNNIPFEIELVIAAVRSSSVTCIDQTAKTRHVGQSILISLKHPRPASVGKGHNASFNIINAVSALPESREKLVGTGQA